MIYACLQVPAGMAYAAHRGEFHPARAAPRGSTAGGGARRAGCSRRSRAATPPPRWSSGALGYLSRASPSLARNARLRPKSTLATAIGVKHPKIVQIAQGAMGGSFNTREFFHGRPREVVRAVRWTLARAGVSRARAAAARRPPVGAGARRRVPRCSTRGCSPSAGTSSPRRSTRRTSTTRRSPEPRYGRM